MTNIPPIVIPSVVEESLRLAACAQRRIYEISPRASLGRDDKGGGGMFRMTKRGGGLKDDSAASNLIFTFFNF